MIPRSERIDGEAELARWIAVARDAGIKVTHQRLEIFRELAGDRSHPDAETVFRAVQQRVPTVSLDTVYRTLWLLRDLGLVTTLGPRQEGIRFDTNVDRHHHFVCVRCGAVSDFVSPELDALHLPDAVRALGGAVHDARVEVRGTCATCLDRSTPSPVPGGPDHE